MGPGLDKWLDVTWKSLKLLLHLAIQNVTRSSCAVVTPEPLTHQQHLFGINLFLSSPTPGRFFLPFLLPSSYAQQVFALKECDFGTESRCAAPVPPCRRSSSDPDLSSPGCLLGAGV